MRLCSERESARIPKQQPVRLHRMMIVSCTDTGHFSSRMTLAHSAQQLRVSGSAWSHECCQASEMSDDRA